MDEGLFLIIFIFFFAFLVKLSGIIIVTSTPNNVKMSTLRPILKYSFVFAVLLLLQNCKIYESAPTDIDEAVVNKKRVKVYDTQMNAYKFNHLEYQDGKLVGVAKKKSKTTKRLLSKEEMDKQSHGFVDVPLSDMEIREVYEQNEDASFAVYAISFGLALASILYLGFFAIN